jgi:hypothetical protein
MKERFLMFCPVCGDEFGQGFSECAQCKVPLVETLPTCESCEPISDEEIEWVTALYSPDLSLISVAKSLLESAGIPYLASGETLAEISARLQVRKEDEEEVKRLLNELE